MSNKGRKQQMGILRNANNKIVISVEGRLKRQKEYVEVPFNDDRPDTPPASDPLLNDVRPRITKS